MAVIFIVEGAKNGMRKSPYKRYTLFGLEIKKFPATSYDNLSRRLYAVVRLDRHRRNAERLSLKLSTLFTRSLMDPTKHSKTLILMMPKLSGRYD